MHIRLSTDANPLKGPTPAADVEITQPNNVMIWLYTVTNVSQVS